MTLSVPNPPRGFENWWSDATRGIKKLLQDICTEVNGLVVGGITPEAIFSADVRTIAVNTTLSTLSRVEYVTASNASLTLTLPHASTEATIFDGGIYDIINAGSTNAFALNDNAGGVLLAAIPPGGTAQLRCTADATQAGSWSIVSYGSLIINATGLQEIYIPAGAMRPSVTGGCQALAALATGANQPDLVTLDFDQSTDEYAQFSIAMPKSWDLGTVKAKFHWSRNGTGNSRVVWGIQGVAVGDDDAIGTSYGTAQLIADGNTGSTSDDLYTSGYTNAATIGGTPAIGDVVFFRISRAATNIVDEMTADARLHGITLAFSTNKSNDA